MKSDDRQVGGGEEEKDQQGRGVGACSGEDVGGHEYGKDRGPSCGERGYGSAGEIIEERDGGDAEEGAEEIAGEGNRGGESIPETQEDGKTGRPVCGRFVAFAPAEAQGQAMIIGGVGAGDGGPEEKSQEAEEECGGEEGAGAWFRGQSCGWRRRQARASPRRVGSHAMGECL